MRVSLLNVKAWMLAVAILAVLTMAPGTAAATTDVGDTAGSGATGGPCTNCSFIQLADNGSFPFTVPGPGVITRYYVRSGTSFSGTNTVSLQLWQNAGGGSWRLAAESGNANIVQINDYQNTYLTRIRASGGERLGLRITNEGNTARVYGTASAADEVGSVLGSPSVGQTLTPLDVFSTANLRVNIAAIWEPDADGDGYGDDSQDLCPGDASRYVTACSGTLIGSTLQGTINAGGGCGSATCSYLSTAVASANTTLPYRGVIVRWRMKDVVGTETFTLNVFSPLGGTSYQASTASASLNGQTRKIEIARSGAVRIPYPAGSFIGISGVVSNNWPLYVFGGSGSTANIAQPGINPGASGSAPTYGDRELMVNADVEADADGDGYGDDTQDSCPARADIQAVCPPDVSAVSLTRKKFKVNKRGAVISVGRGTKLNFTLAGPATTRITVQRLVKRKWRKTHSFLRTLTAGATTVDYSGRYKSRGKKRVLDPGSYRFSIVATNESGSAKGLSGKFKVVK